MPWSDGPAIFCSDRADEADNGVHVSYAIPKEGALAWFDMMAIPSDAPHPDEAHAFINYLMDAQVMAKASNYVYYANGNKASQEFLEEDVIGDPAIYPSEEAAEKLYIGSPYGPRVQREVTRIWTRIITGS